MTIATFFKHLKQFQSIDYAYLALSAQINIFAIPVTQFLLIRDSKALNRIFSRPTVYGFPCACGIMHGYWLFTFILIIYINIK